MDIQERATNYRLGVMRLKIEYKFPRIVTYFIHMRWKRNKKFNVNVYNAKLYPRII